MVIAAGLMVLIAAAQARDGGKPGPRTTAEEFGYQAAIRNLS